MMGTVERAHGTRTKYVHDGCRCFACKVANANQETARAARRRARAPWRLQYVQEIRAWDLRNQLTGDVAGRFTNQQEAYEARESLNRVAASESEQPPLWADAALVRRVRRHLESLAKSGVSLRQVSETTGISRSRLQEILHNRTQHKDRPKRRWLKHATAERLLEVAPSPSLIAPGARVPAAETWRLIEELLAAGLRRYEIAAALGYAGPGIPLQRGEVLKRNADRVRELHDLAYRGSARLRAVCQCPEWRRD